MSLKLSEVLGKAVVDVEGDVSHEFGSDTPVFRVFALVFTDGSRMFVEGEHDMAYLPVDDALTEELLAKHADQEDAPDE